MRVYSPSLRYIKLLGPLSYKKILLYYMAAVSLLGMEQGIADLCL
jgi:hypothetical protein